MISDDLEWAFTVNLATMGQYTTTKNTSHLSPVNLTNYGDADSLESYLDCLSKSNALIIDTSSSHIIIAGDFNCSFNSRFFSEFSDFALE